MYNHVIIITAKTLNILITPKVSLWPFTVHFSSFPYYVYISQTTTSLLTSLLTTSILTLEISLNFFRNGIIHNIYSFLSCFFHSVWLLWDYSQNNFIHIVACHILSFIHIVACHPYLLPFYCLITFHCMEI